MLNSHKIGERRVERYIADVVEQAVFRDAVELDVAVHPCSAPIRFAEAEKAEYAPIARGYRWGPLWSTAWFRLRGGPPRGRGPVHLLFETGVEACLWLDGVPYHGLSKFHKSAPLPREIAVRDAVELFVEAACNGLWGGGDLDRGVVDDRFAHLTVARLARFDECVYGLMMDMQFGLALARSLEERSVRRRELIYALNAAVNAIDQNAVSETADTARSILAPVLKGGAAGRPGVTRCLAIGHAHIDTAWLWPVRETWRKCYRTFSTALRNMETYPDYKFLHTQPAHYEVVRREHPRLFEQIRKRVGDGQWDANAAMWVEADTYIPGGESLIRQILHGTRWLQQHLGVTANCLWIPDNFGYSAALPQIMKQTGLRCMVTQKLSWNELNPFEHHTFRWRGLDDSEVMVHCLAAATYNGECMPGELRQAEGSYAQNDRCDVWGYAFGYGDGGGGPHRDMIERLTRSADCADMPLVQSSDSSALVAELERSADDLPLWEGELYLEYHRGCWTSQAAGKKGNRACEHLLREAEILTCLVGRRWTADERETMDAAWKTVLLNQFHDILCGSSIGEVHREAAVQYAEVQASVENIAVRAAARIGTDGVGGRQNAPGLRDEGWTVLAINALSWERDEVVEMPAEIPPESVGLREVNGGDGIHPVQSGNDVEGRAVRLTRAGGVPSMGYSLFEIVAGRKVHAAGSSVSASRSTLENEIIKAEFDVCGRLAALIDKRTHRNLVCDDEPGNALVLYEDRPIEYDAWNLEMYYREKAKPQSESATVSVHDSGPVRASLRFERPIGRQSRWVQHVSLDAGDDMLVFDTVVNWHESHEILRVLFPTSLRALQATYEVQFGHVARATHMNTRWDLARFEHCAQRWMDLSEPGCGLSLLADCKYGYSCHENVMGLSLLRSPATPDPDADRGRHRFRYAVFPHGGDFRAARTPQKAVAFNCPLRMVAAGDRAGLPAARWSAIQVDVPNVIIETIKPAEDGDDVIVRLYEAFGLRGEVQVTWQTSWGQPRVVDLLEMPRAYDRITLETGCFRWRYRPFEILTVAFPLTAERV